MPSVDVLELIEAEGVRLLRFARSNPDLPVPQYQDWTLADLVSHTGSIHGRTVRVCETLPQDRISAPRLPDGVDPVGFYESNLFAMLDAFRSADRTATVWSFTSDPTIGFWERRMLIETGVHRWDGQQAVEDPDPLLDEVAVAGLDEFNEMWFPHLGGIPPLLARATDLGLTWVLGRGGASVAVEGTASDLYLRLMSRPSSVTLPEAWAAAVDGLGPPPKR